MCVGVDLCVSSWVEKRLRGKYVNILTEVITGL